MVITLLTTALILLLTKCQRLNMSLIKAKSPEDLSGKLIYLRSGRSGLNLVVNKSSGSLILRKDIDSDNGVWRLKKKSAEIFALEHVKSNLVLSTNKKGDFFLVTSRPEGNEDWRLEASQVHLNTFALINVRHSQTLSEIGNWLFAGPTIGDSSTWELVPI